MNTETMKRINYVLLFLGKAGAGPELLSNEQIIGDDFYIDDKLVLSRYLYETFDPCPCGGDGYQNIEDGYKIYCGNMILRFEIYDDIATLVEIQIITA